MSNLEIHLHMTEPWMWYESILYTSSYQGITHRHSAWQLTASIEGVFHFRTEKKEYILNPGDWILLSPELLHDAGSDSAQSRAMQIFFRRFPPDLLPEPAEQFNMRRGLAQTGHGNAEIFRNLAEDFLEKANDFHPMGKTWRTVLALHFTATALSDVVPEKEAPPPPHPEIMRVLEFMEEHFAEPLGIADFAALIHRSESRFITVFKRETGVSPMHFLNTVRLARAQSFLINGLSVEEAARAAGFSSAPYFCRSFKKSIGITPGAFREAPFSHV